MTGNCRVHPADRMAGAHWATAEATKDSFEKRVYVCIVREKFKISEGVVRVGAV